MMVPEMTDFSCILVLRERYLRNDVSCGIQACRGCEPESLSALPMIGEMSHPSFVDGHFVLPDTNVFLSQVGCLKNSLTSVD